MNDWLTDSGKKNDGEVSAMVPFMLAEYVYDPRDINPFTYE